MQHFRLIRTVEVNWKEQQHTLSSLNNGADVPAEMGEAPGADLEQLLNQYIEEQGMGDDTVF